MGDSRPCIGAIARDPASDVSPGRAHDISDVAHSPRPRNKQCCARKRRRPRFAVRKGKTADFGWLDGRIVTLDYSAHVAVGRRAFRDSN